MKKLKINYTHSAVSGKDCDAEAHAKEVISLFLNGETDMEVNTSNEIQVLAFRVLVAEGVISAKQLEIQFDGKPLELTDRGRIVEWPKGFCDVWEDLLLRLL